MKEVINILNRWSGNVMFSAEVEVTPDMSVRFKLGLAIKEAVKSGADLSCAVLSDADLSDADLRDADLSGAVLRGADLSGADLSCAVLSGADLSDAVLRDAVLRGADLSGADLSGADLSGAVLSGAVLSGAVLSGAPKIENIHQKVYAAASQPEALNMGEWHTCDTTHCRAGWIVHLAGDAGYELERKMGGNTASAATAIYLASDPTIDKLPSFYCSNETALEDMKRMADAEAAGATS